MTEYADGQPSFFQNLRRNTLVQGIGIGALALILQLPVLFIKGIVWEREGKWGKQQEVFGPFLVVPYLKYRTLQTEEGKPPRTEVYEGHATFLPSDLRVDGSLATEVRCRGVFEAPVYRSQLGFEGSFDRPDFSGWAISPEDILWDRAELIMEVADPRAIQEAVQIDWAGETLAFEPGTGRRRTKRAGIHVPLGDGLNGETLSFSYVLELNGSMRLGFAPLGRNTEVSLKCQGRSNIRPLRRSKTRPVGDGAKVLL